MTRKFTIADICKEVQRIQFDIENDNIESAIDRCKGLDDLLCDIEDGKHVLSINSPTVERRVY